MEVFRLLTTSHQNNSTITIVKGEDRYTLYSLLQTPITAKLDLTRPLNGISPSVTLTFPRCHAQGNGGRTYEAQVSGAEGVWERRVFVKIAEGWNSTAEQRKEALMYLGPLRKLWNVAVPRFLGHFVGNRSDGKQASALVLELCDGDGPNVPRSPMDRFEFNRLVMVAICKIHMAGVFHGRLLLDGLHPVLRHFVIKDKKLFLVDFEDAFEHKCENGVPFLKGVSFMETPYCDELFMLEKWYHA